MVPAKETHATEQQQEADRRIRELERPTLGLRRSTQEDEQRRRNQRAKELREKNRQRRAGFR